MEKFVCCILAAITLVVAFFFKSRIDFNKLIIIVMLANLHIYLFSQFVIIMYFTYFIVY